MSETTKVPEFNTKGTIIYRRQISEQIVYDFQRDKELLESKHRKYYKMQSSKELLYDF